MKLIVYIMATVGLFCTSQVFAQDLSGCGSPGEIIKIKQVGPNLVGIPSACKDHRQDNWVAAPPEANMSIDDICAKAMKPIDDITGKPVKNMENMSACFCFSGVFPGGDEKTKCWTFYDLAK